MTQKELLYLEDAITHEDNLISFLKKQLDNLKDSDLINFFKQEINIHNKTKKDLLSLLKENCNE